MVTCLLTNSFSNTWKFIKFFFWLFRCVNQTWHSKMLWINFYFHNINIFYLNRNALAFIQDINIARKFCRMFCNYHQMVSSSWKCSSLYCRSGFCFSELHLPTLEMNFWSENRHFCRKRGPSSRSFHSLFSSDPFLSFFFLSPASWYRKCYDATIHSLHACFQVLLHSILKKNERGLDSGELWCQKGLRISPKGL